MRAISILFVICAHLSVEKHNVFKAFYDIKWLNPLIYFITDGGLGVNLFFVISGFLITSLLITENNNNKAVSLKQFYIRRTLRIFPPYFFLLFVYGIIQFMGFIYIPLSSWIAAITYTKDFNVSIDDYTRHAWSLSVEEHFYLLWPFAFIAGDQIRKYTCYLFILIVPILRVFVFFHPISWMSDLSLFIRIDSIAIGCCVAIYRDQILKKIDSNWAIFTFISVFGLFLLRFIPRLALKHHINLKFIFIPFGQTTGMFANIFLAFILIFSIYKTNTWWFRLLNSKTLNYIGILSYSLYLWQQFLLFVPFCDKIYPINIFLIPLAALFSYYVIEKPFLNLKSKFHWYKSKFKTPARFNQ